MALLDRILYGKKNEKKNNNVVVHATDNGGFYIKDEDIYTKKDIDYLKNLDERVNKIGYLRK